MDAHGDKAPVREATIQKAILRWAADKAAELYGETGGGAVLCAGAAGCAAPGRRLGLLF